MITRNKYQDLINTTRRCSAIFLSPTKERPLIIGPSYNNKSRVVPRNFGRRTNNRKNSAANPKLMFDLLLANLKGEVIDPWNHL
jgi:hypothetical protein